MGLTQKLGTIPLAIQTDSSNNVGIGGAANASYKLAVTGAGLYTGNLNINGETLTIGGTTNNAIINNIASVRVNIDCDNTGTGESFTIGHNQTAINDSNVLFRVQDNGNVGIGTTNPTRQLFVNSTAFFDNNGDGSTTNPSIAIGSTSVGLSYIGGGNLALLTGGTERMRIRSNGNKTFNGPGGQDQMFSNSARTSNGDYIDINTESGGGNFQGFLIVANTYAYNGAYRTQGTYSVLGRDTTISATGLSVVNGPTGSSTYSITSPSTGVIRITNTGLYGDLIVSWRGFV